jgi:hypothetical protein
VTIPTHSSGHASGFELAQVSGVQTGRLDPETALPNGHPGAAPVALKRRLSLPFTEVVEGGVAPGLCLAALTARVASDDWHATSLLWVVGGGLA